MPGMMRTPSKSIHAPRRVERGIRAALEFEAWRRQRAAELLHEARLQLEKEARARLRVGPRGG